MATYRVMMEQDGVAVQYGLYADRDWAQVQLEKVRDWYWMRYDSFYIEEVE